MTRPDATPNLQRKKIATETALASLVARDVLQRVQDWFADSSGISVVVRDLEGRRVTRPNYQNPFCERVMESGAGEDACRAAYRKHLPHAARRHDLVKYVASVHLLQSAAPIFVEDVCVGCIVMGGRPEARLSARRLASLSRAISVPADDLASALANVPEWTEEELTRAADHLQAVAHTLEWLCIQGASLRGKLQELESLFEVSRLLASTLDLRKVLKLVARSVVEVLGAKACSIRLLGRRSQRLEVKSYYNLSRRYLNKGVVTLEDSQIDQAALTGAVVQIPDMLNDPRVLYPREAAQEGIRSGVSVGLISKGKPVGTLHAYRAEAGAFDDSAIQIVSSLANYAAVAIDNAQLYQQAQQKRRIQRELRVAGVIQARLLPAAPPDIPGFDIATASVPCQEVGGDFFDFVRLRDGQVAFLIADVAGKGVPGALLMASARATARAYLERTSLPHEAVRRLNVAISHDTRTGHFVSLFCGVLDPHRRRFIYTNAGHNPPLLLRAGRATPLETGGLVLGAEEEEVYEEGRVDLAKGDIVVFYTDGVTEALNAKDEIFGVERLTAMLLNAADASAEEIVTCTRDAIARHTTGVEQSDDITMIVMRVG